MDTATGAGRPDCLRVDHGDRCGKPRSRSAHDPEPLTTAAIRHELDRLSRVDVAEGADGTRATLYRRHLETMLCATRLQEAIDRAERWYAQRADEPRRFDRRATATVRQLVADARVRPSLAWSS